MARWRALCAAAQMVCIAADEDASEQANVNLLNMAISFAELVPTPEVVCLCGSTRHLAAFLDWQRILTMEGRIFLTIGCVLRAGDLQNEDGSDAPQKLQVDLLHRRKIDMADVVLVLDVDGYVGSSTQDEVEYAERMGKRIIRMSQQWPDYRPPSLEQALFGTLAVRIGVRYDENVGCHVASVEVDRG